MHAAVWYFLLVDVDPDGGGWLARVEQHKDIHSLPGDLNAFRAKYSWKIICRTFKLMPKRRDTAGLTVVGPRLDKAMVSHVSCNCFGSISN